jgi:hypothetical protein
MPFDVGGFTAAIVDLSVNPPADAQETADRWAAALGAFFAPVALPTPLPGVLSAAEAAMSAAMAPLVSPVPGVGAVALGAGYAAFTALMVAATPPQAVVPPPALYVPPPLPPINDPNIPAASIAATTVAWAITGTVTIPPASPVPWS